ncbi:hybrid sensor histidine kinase/response regulator [Lederbergia lenta]|uniref:hybrid sensor histidine kinase/response regulator n=1 Tax=Lederbergia lenta TaxID=1467 RepID=UPI00203EB8CD|nr:ATP-binding protein [Lederbergia lenta]MCM3112795.1 ATP-binding protein [Lederbergia lenta]
MLTNQYMSKRRIFLIIGLFIFVLTSFRITWIKFHSTPDHPQAKNGIIDLQDWEFNSEQTISLDGEWEFYPNQFLPPNSDHYQSTALDKHLVSIPNNWNKTISDNVIISPQGFATYRLKILLPENKQRLYGIYVRDISTASKVFINGSLIAESGQPAKSASQYTGKLGPYSAIFQTERDQMEVIIHVANYETTYTGGIPKSIKFGTEPAISKEANSSRSMQMIVCVILLLHGMYALGLYIIGKQQKELIYFSLLLVFAIFSILVDEDRILFSWLPIDIKWSMKLMYLSFAGVLFFMLAFIASAFSLKSRIIQVFLTLYSILGVVILFIPFPYMMFIGPITMLLNFMTYLLMFILLIHIIRKGDSDAIFILLSNTGNFVNILWGIAINANLIKIPYYPYDFIIAIMVFTFFLFKRHIQIFNQNREQTKILQKADKMRDEFLANTSHELRNPLHSVINIAQSILDDKTDFLTNKNRRNLELLIKVGRRMTYTLNDLLDITHLKEKNIHLHKESISIHAIASGVFDMIRFMTEGKNIHLHLDIPVDFPKVIADENRLIQILFNLLHNAVKYTNEGTITLYGDYNEKIAIIYIRDTGIGIDTETQKKIFDPYIQENASMTSIGGGIGLGLSICKQLVELHGGELNVDSSPGQGSVFSFTLLLAESPTIEKAAQSEVAASISINKVLPKVKESELIDPPLLAISSDEPKAKIFVVDDDPVNLIVLNNILSSEYDITTTTSGKDALIHINKGEWDLIISDVMMPHISGYELTQTLRKQFSISELPILLLTARGQVEDVYTAFSMGANDYVVKPVEALELKSRVKALIDLKRAVKDQLGMEAAWLQAQIQPHFLFNTLNTIAALSEIDSERMVILLEEFGNYLRRSFAIDNTRTVIPIKDELALTRSYLFIEKERFRERLQVEWEVDEQLSLKIPPLSIQPIVENAVRHGVLKRPNGGTICIQITDHLTFFKIAIVDDGVGMSQSKVADILNGQRNKLSGIGLTNTIRRLKQLNGEGLQIISAPNQGTTVSFHIPKL